MNKERETILQLDQQWCNAVAERRDVEYILSFWADDAVIFPPGIPALVGKKAIRQFVQQSFALPGFSIGWETTNVVLSGDATMAYTTGTNQTTFNGPDGNRITVYGKAVTVWRKEPSGDWKCVIDIWNEDPKA